MKKVLILSLDYYPGVVGGAEGAIKDITDRVSPDSIEFHMVTMRYDSNMPDCEKIGNVSIYRLGFGKPDPSMEQRKRFPLHLNKYIFQFWAGYKAMSLHKKNDYDAIWAMMAHGVGVPAAIFNIFYPKVPYILTLQEGDPLEHIEKVMRPLWFLFKRAFTKADVLQSISIFLGEWAKRMGYKGEIVHISNGANPRSINPVFEERDIEKLKIELGKKEGEIFIGNTARLVHQKGWDTVIRSLLLLPDNIRHLIVGGGSDEDLLKDLVKELKLESRVIFTGNIERTEVPKYREVIDIFVGPSRSEGLGNAFLSAMAQHVPVIATQVGGIADFLFDKERNPEHETTGFAVDVESPEQIAEKVTYILDHPEEVKKITKTAREMVEDNYDWDTIAKDMETKVFNKAFNIKK